mmetsp:Transcript_24186/g.63858  ORF Transcript_24186/g.63858 Transcript_24186/m.63858 type:complete len:364 (+) Transcript_24186:256-1347(+)
MPRAGTVPTAVTVALPPLVCTSGLLFCTSGPLVEVMGRTSSAVTGRTAAGSAGTVLVPWLSASAGLTGSAADMIAQEGGAQDDSTEPLALVGCELLCGLNTLGLEALSGRLATRVLRGGLSAFASDFEHSMRALQRAASSDLEGETMAFWDETRSCSCRPFTCSEIGSTSLGAIFCSLSRCSSTLSKASLGPSARSAPRMLSRWPTLSFRGRATRKLPIGAARDPRLSRLSAPTAEAEEGLAVACHSATQIFGAPASSMSTKLVSLLVSTSTALLRPRRTSMPKSRFMQPCMSHWRRSISWVAPPSRGKRGVASGSMAEQSSLTIAKLFSTASSPSGTLLTRRRGSGPSRSAPTLASSCRISS